MQESEKQFEVEHVSSSGRQTVQDAIVVEEPMEIRILLGPSEKRVLRSLSITMRTPGHDEELAVGFLFTEGILQSVDQIDQVQTRGVDPDGMTTGNVVRVELRPDVELDLTRLQRHFYTSSSCGVCGKASLQALDVQGIRPIESTQPIWSSQVIHQLPNNLRQKQPTFERTGGLHAAGLADTAGDFHLVREDVGRHNAVDKLIGHRFLQNRTPLSELAMVVSGRASFEILQKAAVAGIPLLVSVGAPSTLAVDLAQKYQMSLVGFASQDRFNIYSCGFRIG